MQEKEENQSKTFVVGDIHGASKALIQVLERCKFDPEKDTLIQLGDVADGWSEVRQCVDILLEIPKLIAIRGNHDEWTQDWLESEDKIMPDYHRNQGGQATYNSYAKYYSLSTIPQQHIDFFKNQKDYYLNEKGQLFVHGGFNRHYPIVQQVPYILYWDRDLWMQALSFKQITGYANGEIPKFKIADPNIKEVFIGHTTTMSWKTDQPMNAACIWNLDTGAGWNGRLTIMDVDTKEYWQSDPVRELYPESLGRGAFTDKKWLLGGEE